MLTLLDELGLANPSFHLVPVGASVSEEARVQLGVYRVVRVRVLARKVVELSKG